MKVLISLFFFLACASLTVDAACDTSVMKTCYKSYFRSLGFSEFPFPPFPNDFENTVVPMMKNSEAGLEKSCNAFSTLYKCLGSTSDCITYDTVARALDNTINITAADYVAAFFVAQYICGSGKEGLFFLIKI